MQVTEAVETLTWSLMDFGQPVGKGRYALIKLPPLPEFAARVIAQLRGFNPDMPTPDGDPIWQVYAKGDRQIPAEFYAENEYLILSSTTIVPF